MCGEWLCGEWLWLLGEWLWLLGEWLWLLGEWLWLLGEWLWLLPPPPPCKWRRRCWLKASSSLDGKKVVSSTCCDQLDNGP